VTTERILSKEQTAEIGYLRIVLGVILRDKEHRSEIRKARDVKPISPNREIPAMLVRPCVQNVPARNGHYVLRATVYTHGESGPKVDQGPGDVTVSPNLLGPALVWSQQNYLRLLLIVSFFGSF